MKWIIGLTRGVFPRNRFFYRFAGAARELPLPTQSAAKNFLHFKAIIVQENFMTTATHPRGQTIARIWKILQHPKLFGALILILAIEGVLALVIPQRPEPITSPGQFVVWVSSLPPFLQQSYQFFDNLRLFSLFHSLWVWLPAAALMLISLVALADILPATVQRLHPTTGKLLPHPLQTTATRQLRITAPQNPGKATATDPTMDALHDKLTAAKFTVAHRTDTELLAVRHPQAWLAPVLVLGGIVLLITGLAIQTVWGNSQQILLASGGAPTTFIGQTVQITGFSPGADGGGLLSISADGQLAEWQLGHWQRQRGWWLAPPKAQPLAKITFNDGNATENLTLIFDDIARPLVFTYAPRGQSLELQYLAANGHGDYRLRVRDAQNATIETATQRGQNFSLPKAGITGQIIIQDKFLLRAYRLPGAAPIALGALLVLFGATMWFFGAPATVQLTAVTKGRGSRVDATIHTLAKQRTANTLASALFSAMNEEGATNDDAQA